MKRIGILGGMSWHSTAHYYRLANVMVHERLGGYHCADLVVRNLDFGPVRAAMEEGRWDRVADLVRAGAVDLAQAGALLILVATNTVHKVLPEVAPDVPIPFLHIADPVGERCRDGNLRKVAWLGSLATTREGFIVDRLRERFGLEVILPDRKACEFLDGSIFGELVHGRFSEATRERYRRTIEELVAEGAEAVVYGCTEIGLLMEGAELPCPAFDTTVEHVRAAVEWALAGHAVPLS